MGIENKRTEVKEGRIVQDRGSFQALNEALNKLNHDAEFASEPNFEARRRRRCYVYQERYFRERTKASINKDAIEEMVQKMPF